MRDDQRRASNHEAIESLCHLSLGKRIQMRGGLIQNQDGGILEDGPSDGQALALAAAQP